jgi:hypothetical protein
MIALRARRCRSREPKSQGALALVVRFYEPDAYASDTQSGPP